MRARQETDEGALQRGAATAAVEGRWDAGSVQHGPPPALRGTLIVPRRTVPAAVRASEHASAPRGTSTAAVSEHARPAATETMHRPAYRLVVVEAAGCIGVMLRNLFEKDDVAVEIHRDTRQAVASVLQATPDLLLLDVAVGPIEAFMLLSTLRQLPCCPPVVVSGHDAREARERAFALGALDYISTPIAAVELRARIGAALRNVRRVNRGSGRTQRLRGRDTLAR